MIKDNIIKQINELSDLMSNQDKLIADILDKLVEYRRNHSQMYVMQQKLRSIMLTTDNNVASNYNLYILKEDELIIDPFIVNPPQKLEGYHLKFNELYDSSIGNDGLYCINKLLVSHNSNKSYYVIEEQEILFLNFEVDTHIRNRYNIQQDYQVKLDIDNKSVIIDIHINFDSHNKTVYYTYETQSDIEILGFTLKELEST